MIPHPSSSSIPQAVTLPVRVQPVSTWKPQPLPHHSYAHVNELAYRAIRKALFGPIRSRAIRRDAASYKAALKQTTEALRRAVGE